MSGTFELNILTPDKQLLAAQATEVMFGTPDGRLGVMAGHMPMIAAVDAGAIEILIDGEWKSAAVGRGFVDVEGTKVDFFVDTAEWADEIDVARAREALLRAELRMKNSLSHIEYIRTKAAIARALARLRASKGDRQ